MVIFSFVLTAANKHWSLHCFFRSCHDALFGDYLGKAKCGKVARGRS